MIMKKILFIALAIAAVVLSGCRKQTPEAQLSGLQLKITTEQGDYLDKVVKSGAGIDVNSFVVTISKKDGKFSNTWTYGELPKLVELSTGEYTVTVTSPEAAPVAWDTPVYGGTKDFAIVGGVITPVELVCTLQNMKNSVYCSQHFMDQLSDFEVKISNADGHLVWGADEVGVYTEENGVKTIVKQPSKHAYFTVNALTVNVDGYRELDNTTANLMYEIKDVAARDHHIIYLDAYVTGQAAMTLRIDASVNDKNVDMTIPGIDPDDAHIDDDIQAGWEESDGEDEPVIPDTPSDAPYLVWEANPDFEIMNIEQGMSVELMVYAPAKIKEFVVKVSDNFLPAIQMLVPGAQQLDLINDEVAKNALGTMLPVGDQLLNQTEVMFSLSKLVPMIAAVGNQGEEYVFTLEVVDQKGQKLVQDVLFYNPVVE